jgi:lipoate-protein ligase B
MAALPRRFLSSQAAAPILYHYFPTPLPYAATLSLQHRIHELQLARRHAQTDYPDIMLVLQHRPVYTAGRRQKEEDLLPESLRLRQLGADYVHTDRGGQTTYHGPGQIVVYPFFDLGRMQVMV